MSPEISIILPVRNGLPYVREAVASLIGQSFHNWEAIIVDDGSTDGTWEFLRNASEDQRIRPVRNKGRGLTVALNFGLQHARGSLIARMDSDDVAVHKRLQQQKEYLAQHNEIGVVGTCAVVIDAWGNECGEFEMPLNHKAIVEGLLDGSTTLIHPSVMMRRSILNLVDAYDESLEFAQDFDLWLRLADRTRFANMPDRLLQYRYHGSAVGMERRRRQAQCALRSVERAYNRMDRTLPEDVRRKLSERAKRKPNNYITCAKLAIQNGYRGVAWKNLATSILKFRSPFRATAILCLTFVPPSIRRVSGRMRRAIARKVFESVSVCSQ
ncbi:glycosyltransferase family 2 protein [Stratiformator vulcanicus]|uniref:Glycosyltransferase EpsE n=1 Tax=Stratiformator vulcanicus TaxID=2527980 RepID=A0A517QVT3_9PLAN|nr:glycosyltransferase [Stratiformator vulcanicus]QDT35769.1 Putative glycosyltransferase EpsE [Stratiformator vulcanicus]